jgi:hypothetical protein
MLLAEIEKHVKPLSKAEKEQLIRDIERMLVEDEIEQHGDEMLREISKPGIVYEIATPILGSEDSGARASQQLQQFLEENRHDM